MQTPNALPPRPRTAAHKFAFSIVASQYNPQYVQGLVNAAAVELRSLAPGSTINLVQVPGAFEIPMAVKKTIQDKSPSAVIAVGVIIEGETDHARLIAETTTQSLQRLSLDHSVPVIHCVLSVKSEEQARARCLEQGELNRGVEAARAAVEMARLFEESQPRA